MQTVAALRSAGVTLPIATVDLGTEVAIDLASGGAVKVIGAQQPYDMGAAEALAAANILIGNTVPSWISLPSYAVTPKNVLSAYKDVFHKDPPAELVDACKKSGLCN